MDVVLLRHVKPLGAEGEVVQVKAGFARNYLIPHGLAVAATTEQLKAVQERKHAREQKAEREKQQALALKRKLEGRSLTLKLSLGEGEKAFGAITTHDVVHALAQDGLPVDKHSVQLDQPIKALGIYDVPVRLHPEVAATVKVWVVKE